MKRIGLILSLVILTVSGYTQSVIKRTFGTNTVDDPRQIHSLNLIIPRYLDTTSANGSIGIDSCGAIIFTYADNSQWIRQCNPKKWVKQLKAGDAANVYANNALIKNGDTIQLGQPQTDHGNTSMIEYGPRFIRVFSQIDSRKGRSGSIVISNDNIDSTSFVPVWGTFLASPQKISLAYWERTYKRDSAQPVQYGGVQTVVEQHIFDTADTKFDINSPATLGLGGIYSISRLRPAKNMFIASGPFGTSFAGFRNTTDIGTSIASYDINIISNSANPNYPVAGIHNSNDFDRSTNNAFRRITGNGVASFLSDARSYQSNITSGTTEYGSIIGKHFGFFNYGLTLDHNESPSKTKTLNVSRIDSLFGFYSEPLWKDKNEVANGYPLVLMGTNDHSFLGGFLRIGGKLPTVANGNQNWRFEVRDSLASKITSSALVKFTDSGSTYNTTAGAITNINTLIEGIGTRATGSPSLTNIALQLTSGGAQDSIALKIPSGDVRFGNNTFAGNREYIQMSNQNNIVSTATGTQKKQNVYIQQIFNATDSFNVSNNSNGLSILTIYKPTTGISMSDHNRGNSVDAGLYLQRPTGSTGPRYFMGRNIATPSGGAVTMPSALVARLSLSQAQTAGNELIANGWWAAFSPIIDLSARDTIENAVWGNFGGGQFTAGGAVKGAAYGIYINLLGGNAGAVIANRYAMHQVGNIDSVRLDGIVRLANLSSGANTDSIVTVLNGVTRRVLPSINGFILQGTNVTISGTGTLASPYTINASGGGGGSVGPGLGIDSTVVNGTPGSVLFVKAGPTLGQDNTNFFWDNTNKRFGLGINSSLVSKFHLVTNGINTTLTDAHGVMLETTDLATVGAQKYSPGVVFSASGWKTTATAGPQSVKARINLEPVQGTTNPTGNLILADWNINAAGYGTNRLIYTSGGILQPATSMTVNGSTYAASITLNGNINMPSANNVNFASRSQITSPANGDFLLSNTAGNGWGMLKFGVNSSSWFGIKAKVGSTTIGQVRLADDSNFGGWETGTLQTNGNITANNVHKVSTILNMVGHDTDSLLKQISLTDLYTLLGFADGTYVPTPTGVTNYDGTFAVQRAFYTKQKNKVHVSLDLAIGATTGSADTEIEITFPIATTLSVSANCNGQVRNYNSFTLGGYVTGNVSTNRAVIHFTSASTPGFNNVKVAFDYEILP